MQRLSTRSKLDRNEHLCSWAMRCACYRWEQSTSPVIWMRFPLREGRCDHPSTRNDPRRSPVMSLTTWHWPHEYTTVKYYLCSWAHLANRPWSQGCRGHFMQSSSRHGSGMIMTSQALPANTGWHIVTLQWRVTICHLIDAPLKMSVKVRDAPAACLGEGN